MWRKRRRQTPKNIKEYRSVINGTNPLTHTTEMNLQNTVLSKRSRKENTMFCMTPFMWSSRKGKTSVRG